MYLRDSLKLTQLWSAEREFWGVGVWKGEGRAVLSVTPISLTDKEPACLPV